MLMLSDLDGDLGGGGALHVQGVAITGGALPGGQRAGQLSQGIPALNLQQQRIRRLQKDIDNIISRHSIFSVLFYFCFNFSSSDRYILGLKFGMFLEPRHNHTEDKREHQDNGAV